MDNRWTERIALAIVMSMIGLFIGSYTDVGKFSVRLDYIERELATKPDNRIILEWMKRNKEDMKVILGEIKENEGEMDKLREEMHSIEKDFISINVTRGYYDHIEWDYENLISFEWKYDKELNDE